jgi:DNA polymerase-3 subunit gamma/tau
MLTVQAWNSLLKILEEPPEYVIFLFCTTDPQKIIGTIMSRVQRFNFQRISIDGIYNRLKYIIENENKERAMTDEPVIVYEENALRYIARLAQGGMRDSITTLEKCLDYNTNLSLQNVLTVTSGGVTEATLLQMTDYIITSDCKSALLYFNEIYMSGVDVLLFLKLYIEYLQNCTKYLITGSPDITTLSNLTLDYLDKNLQQTEFIRNVLEDILQIDTRYSAEDLKIIVESWFIKICR